MKQSCWWMSAAMALCFAVSAGAQTLPDEATKAAARTLAETARRRFDAGDYAGAIKAALDAEKLFPAPTIRWLRAQAHVKLAQLVEAREVCGQLADEQLSQSAPRVFKQAQEAAERSLSSLDARTPRVTINVASAATGTRVSLDNKVLDSAALARPIRLNPGRHVVVIEPPGAAKITRELDLAEAAVEKVSYPAAPLAVPTATAQRLSSEAALASKVGRPALGPAINFGIAGAGLLTGVISGGIALATAEELKKKCGGQLVCPPSYRDKVDNAMVFGHISTVGFAVAGVSAATGIVLLLLPSKNAEPAKVRVVVGPAFLGVRGAF